MCESLCFTENIFPTKDRFQTLLYNSQIAQSKASVYLIFEALIDNLPTKLGPSSQLCDAKPPKTFPSVSRTSTTVGPLFLICDSKVAKLAPWRLDEKQKRHWSWRCRGRWWLRMSRVGMWSWLRTRRQSISRQAGKHGMWKRTDESEQSSDDAACGRIKISGRIRISGRIKIGDYSYDHKGYC